MLDKPYCAVEDVNRITKNSENELTSWYEQCITQASRMVDTFCFRDFWFHDHSTVPYLVQDCDVIESLIALPFPIITLTQISVSEMNSEVSSSDLVNAKDYKFRVGKRLVEHRHVFTPMDSLDDVRVTGTFGYPLDTQSPNTCPPPTIPTDVRRATALIAAALSEENRKEVVGFDGSRQEIHDNRIPKEVKTMLAYFRIERRFNQ